LGVVVAAGPEKLKLNLGAAGVVLDVAGAATGVCGVVLPNEKGAGVVAVVEDEAGAALEPVLNPVKANLGASVGLFAVALLEPPNTLCVWAAVAPNGEGPEPVLLENAD